jgi:hypothetical protein
MFMTYLDTKYRMTVSSGLLITAIELKSKGSFRTTVMLLFYPPQINKFEYFSKDFYQT